MKHLFFSRLSLLLFVLLSSCLLHAQIGIEGQVTDKKNKEPLTGATILIEGTSKGTTADIDGNYKFTNLSEGI